MAILAILLLVADKKENNLQSGIDTEVSLNFRRVLFFTRLISETLCEAQLALFNMFVYS